MSHFGVDPHQLLSELSEKMSDLKISSEPNECGEYIIDFSGTEEELLKHLNCIKLEDALKNFNDFLNDRQMAESKNMYE